MTNTGDKPRLLVLTSTFPRWEGDHEPPFVFELARRLTRHFDVTVLAPHAPGAKRREVMEKIHVERFRYAPDPFEKLAYEGGIPTRLRRYPWLALLVPVFLLSQVIHARRLVKRLAPSAIHAHWLLPQGLVGQLCADASSPRPRLVVTAHGADLQGLNSALARWLKRRVLAGSDAVTVVSRALADRAAALRADPQRVHVLPMGVDLAETFVPGKNEAPEHTLVFAGRLVDKKGVAPLLRAMPKVLRHYPDCRLLVAGEGPLRPSLDALAHDLGIESQVNFLGRYRNSDLPATLARARVAVLPFQVAAGGDQEGLGLVAVEALGCGLPVVVGNVPAVSDVIVHEQTGLIANAGDNEDLAGQILRLFDDPAFAQRLANAGRAHALARFDWQAVAAGYAEVLSP